jgi:hypothetical protein
MKKRVVWCVIGIVFGAIGIFGGISKMGSTRVECGGKSMYPGDTCEVTSKTGSKQTRTYAEQAESNKGENWVIVAGGGIIILVSAWQLVKGLRARSKAAKAGPPDLTAHWDQQPRAWPAPQPQQQPAQYPQPPPPVQYQQPPQPPQGWRHQQQPIPYQQPRNQDWS